MSATALHLHLPGLLGPLPDQAAGLIEAGEAGRDLALLLSRGKLVREVSGLDADFRRLSLFGLEVPLGADIPVGPLSALGDGFDPGETWIYRADPVHLHPDRDSLLVLEPGRLALPVDLVAELVRDFNRLFIDDGLMLIAPHPDRWYLQVTTTPRLRTTPLAQAIGRAMGESLPTGEHARTWVALLNEVQMLLHESALNRHRQSEGYRSVNSIWPWGGGRLPPPPDRARWSLVCSDNALVRGLARHTGIPCAPLTDLVDLLDQAESEADGPVLIDMGRFPAVADSDTFQEWESALNAFALEGAVPLYQALRNGRLQRLVLDLGERRWELKAASLRYFWRRNRPLAYWLERSRS
ncbi:MAG: hypothetical protein WED00_17005 [Aquisalimonadaceae bacterium]